MADISKNKLMLVDDPKEALLALFKHPGEIITDNSYVEVYMKVKYKNKKNKKEAGETKAETHLGTLRIYGLVEQIPSMAKGKNRITIKGKILKEIWSKQPKLERNEEFKKALSDILLTNPYKGNLYKEFLRFMEKERTRDEVKEKYQWRTAYTILAWAELADLIAPVGRGKYKKKMIKNTRNEIPVDKMWQEVRRSYDEIRSMDYDKKRLIIDFSDLRFRAAYNLGLSDPKEFDRYFTKLMHSDYRQFINLHGALVGDFNEERDFHYKGRLYPNISLVSKD